MKMKKVLNNAAAQTQKLSLIMRRKESITEKQMWDLSNSSCPESQQIWV